MPAVNLLLFVVLPYAAVAVAVVATFERYRRRPYSVTSHSSQFLENRQHFWGIVPFHYGLLPVLIGHAIAFALPGVLLAWNASPTRLYVLEAIGLILGLLATAGLAALVLRRAAGERLRPFTTRLDWMVYALLLVQLASGVYIALAHSWGSSWFAAAATPYLWSLVRLQPDTTLIGAMPLPVKAHVAAAFMLVAVFPFSRLVHVLAVPNAYLWRRPQVVRWRRGTARAAGDL
jgi:nitrate reductase gamma subunit